MNKVTTQNEKLKTVRQMLARNESVIAGALPQHLTAKRMTQVAFTCLRQVPALQDCTPESFVGAIIQCSEVGLEPGGALGFAWLIPYKNNKKGVKEVQFQIGYKGMIDLVRRSGQLSTIDAQIVYETDEFSYELGLHPDIKHKPGKARTGEILYVYAVAVLKDGGRQFSVLSKSEVDKVRKGSKASTSGPWVTHYEEMAKKTALKRLCKLLPVSIEFQRAMGLDDLHDAGIAQDLAEGVVDIPHDVKTESLDDFVDEPTPDELEEQRLSEAAK